MLILVICVIIISGIVWYTLRDKHVIKIDKGTVMDFGNAMDLAGLPIVVFYQKGKKYNFLLDTGSNVSYVNGGSDIEISDVYANEESITAGGNMNVSVHTIELEYKEAKYQCAVRKADLTGPFNDVKSTYGVTLTGIIGCDFMDKYKYCLDFKEMIVYVRK